MPNIPPFTCTDARIDFSICSNGTENDFLEYDSLGHAVRAYDEALIRYGYHLDHVTRVESNGGRTYKILDDQCQIVGTAWIEWTKTDNGVVVSGHIN